MSCQVRPTADDVLPARRAVAALATPLVPTAQAAGTAMAEAARKPRRETRRDEGEGGRCGNIDIPSAGRQSARMAGPEANYLLHRLFWSRIGRNFGVSASTPGQLPGPGAAGISWFAATPPRRARAGCRR